VSDLSILGVYDDDYDRSGDGRQGRRAGGRGSGRRGSRRGRGRRGGVVVLLIVVVVLAGLGLGGKMLYANVTGGADYSGDGTGSVDVQVKRGDSARDIGVTLAHQGVVQSEGAFAHAAAAEPRSRTIQPGYYRLRQRMSASAALGLLLDPRSRLNTKVTIPEGYTSRQVYTLLGQRLKINPRVFLDAAQNPQALGVPAGIRSVEGFLFPATYDLDPGATPVEALRQMVATWTARVNVDVLTEAGRPLGLNWYQVLTVASLVEEEAITADFAKVARVVDNRLRTGMRLGFDSTINYVLNRPRIRLSEQDTFLETPYNTYRHAGLPPTPIANPGLAAVLAAMSPARGSWLYFVKIDKAGHSYFTGSYDDFLRHKAQAQANGIY